MRNVPPGQNPYIWHYEVDGPEDLKEKKSKSKRKKNRSRSRSRHKKRSKSRRKKKKHRSCSSDSTRSRSRSRKKKKKKHRSRSNSNPNQLFSQWAGVDNGRVGFHNEYREFREDPYRLDFDPHYASDQEDYAQDRPQLFQGEVLQLTLPEDAPILRKYKLDNICPAISYDKIISDRTNLFGNSSGIVHCLCDENKVELIHDCDWKLYPQVGEAYVKAGGDAEWSMCIAICKGRMSWGVGIGGKWKLREHAAKLALAVSLAAVEGQSYQLREIARWFPEFDPVYGERYRLMLSPDGSPVNRPKPKYADVAIEDLKKPPALPPIPAHTLPTKRVDMYSLQEEDINFICGLPQNQPVSIKLEESTVPHFLSGFPTRGITIAVDNKKLGATLFGCAESILEDLAADKTNIKDYHDDDWNKYPGIYTALQKAGAEQLCYVVAVSSSPRVWAVGMSSKWQNRLTAAKFGVALQLAKRSPSFDMLCARYAGLREMCKAFNDEPDPEPLNTLIRFPRDSPIWISFPENQPRPHSLKNLPANAIAVCMDGDQRNLYFEADAALDLLIRNPATQVQYLDEAYGDKFPGVSTALKQVAREEANVTLAVCTSLGAWGVGISYEQVNRFDAAKLALASVLAYRAISADQGIDFSPFPDFDAFVARLMNGSV